MRQFIHILLLLLSATLGFSVYGAESSPPKKVQVIFGYENIGRWEQRFTEAISQVFLDDPRVIFNVDYLPLDVQDPNSFTFFSVFKQIRPNNVDAVIAVRPQSSAFVNRWKDTFFRGIPRIYVAPGDDVVPDTLEANLDVLVPSAVDTAARETFEVLPKLLPNLEHIYVLAGDSSVDIRYLERIRGVIEVANLQQTIHYLIALTPDEVIAELNAAPQNTAAVFAPYSKDRTGQLFRTSDVVSIVSGQIDKPLFGLFDGLHDSGIVGGSMTSATLYGRKAAEQALSSLFDEAPPGSLEIPTTYFFDAKQLDRFGIDRERLPDGSEVANTDPSLLQQYWWLLALGGTALVIQLFLIMALGQALRRRNKAEAEREDSIAVMHEAQRIARVGSWQLDLASNQLTWTRELYSMHGLDPQFSPPNFKELSKLFTPESWERLSTSLSQAIESGKPYELELEMVKPDGKQGWMLAKGEVLRDARGSIVGLRGTAMDTTERNAINEQLRRSQKMEAVGQLTGGIAHDFNNILGVVAGNLELIQIGVADNKEILECVDEALDGTSRGAALIDRLLGFSRAQPKETSLVSVNQLIENMNDLLEKSLTVSIKIETYLDAKLWPVNVDGGDLEDAILNLALNARDAMPNSGKLSIETANKILDEDFVKNQPEARVGEYAMLSVSDTGIGMMPEIKERILEPFFTTKTDGKGTGLGLSMVYGFVQRSGGFIIVYSAPSAGTSVKIFLPRGHDSGQEGASSIVEEELPRGVETVLVVDDEEQLTKLAVANLERLGYKTLAAFDGKSALALIEDNPDIDLLFSDVVMPGELDGYQLGITAKKSYPRLKILLTSGFSKLKEDDFSSDSFMHKELSANLLRKPYSRIELARAVRKALDRKLSPSRQEAEEQTV